jgi:hypothetical protein
MTSCTWTNPGGGDWGLGGDWSTGQVPGPGDDVVIRVPFAATVTHASGTDSIRSLDVGITDEPQYGPPQNLLISGGSALAVTTAFTLQANTGLGADGGPSRPARGTEALDGLFTPLGEGTTAV